MSHYSFFYIRWNESENLTLTFHHIIYITLKTIYLLNYLYKTKIYNLKFAASQNIDLSPGIFYTIINFILFKFISHADLYLVLQRAEQQVIPLKLRQQNKLKDEYLFRHRDMNQAF